MAEMKTFNGYEVVDAKARQDIAELQNIDIQDSYYLDFTAATINYTECDAEMIKCCETLVNGGDACIYLKDSYDNYFYPAVATITPSRITLSKSGLNLNSVANSTPVKWDVISLILTDKWYYYKLGSNEATFVTSANVDKTVTEAMTDYALKEDIPSLEGYATEDYVNTSVSGVSCVTEVINVTNITETSTQITDDYTKGILNRILSGEKFPVCLFSSTVANSYEFPKVITYGGGSIVIRTNYSLSSLPANGLYLENIKYSFDKSNDVWTAYYTKYSHKVE